MTSVSVSGERSQAFQRNMITASVMMATTVVIIDMTIATIALPHMQGGLSASQDQVSWVMTTYFMMQAITMSATGWLAGPTCRSSPCPMIAARTPGRGARRSTTPTSSFSACPTMRRAKRCR